MNTLAPSLREFGEWLAREYRADGGYDEARLLDGERAHPADLLIRLDVTKKSYYLARIKDGLLEVGFATEGRMINEAIEEMILDNGGDLDDLLGDELCDLGDEPLTMKHYFERPAFFFVVPLPLGRSEELDDPILRQRVKTILKASRTLFQSCVDEG